MKFNENQIKAINHFEGNCCVMASAGSGKTSVLVNRIVNLINTYDVSPENILAITFSVKAKENMENRLESMLGEIYKQITIDTFHGLGNKMLKESKYNYYYKTLQNWQQKSMINNIVIKDLKLADNDNDVKANYILGYISFHKNNLIDCDGVILPIADMPYGLHTMKEIYKRYEKSKNYEKSKDFEDMLINTYKLLKLNSKELNKYQDRYKFILVDEFQDTNKAMYEIIRLLGKKYNNVFVVGDALQNIYEWNSANNNYIINFHKDWLDTTVIPLNINYRSTQNIVELSNKLVKNTKETTHKYYVESISNKPKHKAPVFTTYEDEIIESEEIAKSILDNKYKYSDVAILSRTNFMSQALEKGLYKNNIPYEIVGGKSFYEQREIKDMISYLRLVADTKNDESFKQIYNSPNRYLGNVFLTELSSFSSKYKMSLFDSMFSFPRSDEWRYQKGIMELNNIISKLQKRKKYKVGELIDIIRQDLSYDKFILKEDYDNNDRNEKIENLDTLVNIANKFKSIDEFLMDVENILSFNKKDNVKDKVKIMTIHKSKGLEFPIVYIASVNDGILPHTIIFFLHFHYQI